MKRSLSYRQGLTAAIRTWLPHGFFGRWALRHGLRWTPQRLVWLALLMAWSAEQTLAERFEGAADLLRVLFPWWRLGRTYTGFSQALAAWDDALRPALAQRLRRRLQTLAGRHWTRQGWCAFAADGSRYECPRTRANQEELGCAGKQRTAPQLFLTSLWHMGTGQLWDYRVGPGTASERRHLEGMLADLPAEALVVADAGFVGYDLCARVVEARRHFLLRVGANVHLLQQLGYAEVEDDGTVYLWPEDRRDQEPLVLRLLVLPRGKKRMYLLTDVLHEPELPAEAAALLYEMRWGVEIFYRSSKQTLARRKMLSHAPGQAEVELAWAILGLWLLGLMSLAGILARGQDPLSWSVALARKHVRQAMRRAVGVRRCPAPLADQLATATRDGYERHGSKKARDWPHKKREKPPGEPKIRVATAEEVSCAQEVRNKKRVA